MAALEGLGFHYFCDASCKRQFLSARGRPQEEDVTTARPPDVVAGPEAASASTAPASDPEGRATLPSLDSHEPFELLRPSSAGAGGDGRVVAQSPRVDVPRDRAAALIDGAGIVAGVLTPAVGLVGAVTDATRVPLVLFAWAALAMRVKRATRDPSDPHALVVLAPSGAAVIAACWAQITSDTHAVSIAIFAGVACAVAIIIEATVTRLRANVQVARERIEGALDARVRVIRGDETIELPAADVRPGEQILVEATELVGVDAVVTAGDAVVIPWLNANVRVAKREGDPIVAGALVVSNRLRMTTTWSGRERAWVKLSSAPAARIEVAAPTVRFLRHTVERGTAGAALLVGAASFAADATPVQILAATSAGAIAFAAKALVASAALHFARAHLSALSSGITYKDPRAFERAASANVVVLTARGALRCGEPEIVAIEALGASRRDSESADDEAARILSLAAGAETASTHPFASAILRAARARSTVPEHVRNATVHAGLGVTALASTGDRLIVGGRAIMLAEKVGVAAADARVTELETQGRSVLLVALGDRLVGLIALQDGIRAGARAAVQRLLDARIEPILLSGEARDTCETIGRTLDIEHVRPAVLPADRGREVRALSEGGSVVAVVGHPLADDAALGAADIAIAMGAAGSTPGEWAVALASDDVRDAAQAIIIPHRTRSRVRIAIALGSGPCIVALLAVSFGVAPLAVAPLASLVGAIAVAVHARESLV